LEVGVMEVQRRVIERPANRFWIQGHE